MTSINGMKEVYMLSISDFIISYYMLNGFSIAFVLSPLIFILWLEVLKIYTLIQGGLLFFFHVIILSYLLIEGIPFS